MSNRTKFAVFSRDSICDFLLYREMVQGQTSKIFGRGVGYLTK